MFNFIYVKSSNGFNTLTSIPRRVANKTYSAASFVAQSFSHCRQSRLSKQALRDTAHVVGQKTKETYVVAKRVANAVVPHQLLIVAFNNVTEVIGGIRGANLAEETVNQLVVSSQGYSACVLITTSGTYFITGHVLEILDNVLQQCNMPRIPEKGKQYIKIGVSSTVLGASYLYGTEFFMEPIKFAGTVVGGYLGMTYPVGLAVDTVFTLGQSSLLSRAFSSAVGQKIGGAVLEEWSADEPFIHPERTYENYPDKCVRCELLGRVLPSAYIGDSSLFMVAKFALGQIEGSFVYNLFDLKDAVIALGKGTTLNGKLPNRLPLTLIKGLIKDGASQHRDTTIDLISQMLAMNPQTTKAIVDQMSDEEIAEMTSNPAAYSIISISEYMQIVMHNAELKDMHRILHKQLYERSLIPNNNEMQTRQQKGKLRREINTLKDNLEGKLAEITFIQYQELIDSVNEPQRTPNESAQHFALRKKAFENLKAINTREEFNKILIKLTEETNKPEILNKMLDNCIGTLSKKEMEMLGFPVTNQENVPHLSDFIKIHYKYLSLLTTLSMQSAFVAGEIEPNITPEKLRKFYKNNLKITLLHYMSLNYSGERVIRGFCNMMSRMLDYQIDAAELVNPLDLSWCNR